MRVLLSHWKFVPNHFLPQDVYKRQDVRYMIEILRSIGCGVLYEGDVLQIDASEICLENISRECVGKMRSSILLLGAALGRCRRMILDYPGGCTIGARPVDIHLKALEQMGVHIEEKDGAIHLSLIHISARRQKVRIQRAVRPEKAPVRPQIWKASVSYTHLDVYKRQPSP